MHPGATKGGASRGRDQGRAEQPDPRAVPEAVSATDRADEALRAPVNRVGAALERAGEFAKSGVEHRAHQRAERAALNS